MKKNFHPVIATACLAFLFTVSTSAEKNLEPEIFTLTFSEDASGWLDGTGERPDHWPDWVRGIEQRNGTVNGEGAWQSDPNVVETESSFDVLIDSENLIGDLAFTLAFSTEGESDFVIQLYDDQSKVLAVDLFGNINEGSILAGTDTYIVPVSKYPSASRITLRGVSGQLTLFGLVAFPVLGELPTDPETEVSILNVLGGVLSESSPLYRALNDVVPDSEQSGLRDESGKLLSREEIIASLRAEIVKEVSRDEKEFEARLIGTEWLLEDFYRRRLARFLPGGVMHQQHVDDETERRWDDEIPPMERSYRVIDHETVLFGIGGFIATFNENFTEMTYATSGGRKGQARLKGRFVPGK